MCVTDVVVGQTAHTRAMKEKEREKLFAVCSLLLHKLLSTVNPLGEGERGRKNNGQRPFFASPPLIVDREV